MGEGGEKRAVIDADQFRELFDRALTDLDSDERGGALLRAAGLRLRLELTDLGLVARVEASDHPAHHLEWSFEDEGAPAKLDLRMDSGTANAYLQGRESLAIAIARGRVRCSGDSMVAVAYLPALKLLVEPYRRWVDQLHPQLAVL